MAIDYVQLAQTASTLIDQNGRQVRFVRFNQTSGDNAKPWEGPADENASVDAEDTTAGVFVQPSSATTLGMSAIDTDLLKRTEDIIIVAGTAGFDLATANAVFDNNIRKRITFVETLRPNTVTLLYFIGVRR